ncbi:sigma-54 dependent transcriptional regulator [bacterium]|nr:sigma-54 dependent transcriptional regulator [bacterium]MCI0604025.1 sigma-54 dependent transcriptional regulator [bacterium]
MITTVLLVDDEAAIRFSFTKYLTRTGFQITEAATLNDARIAVGNQRFDAVLLDLNLPDGNGLDWIQEVRSMQPDVAIVVITGIGDIPSAVEAMRRGADHFLTKPVNMSDLELFLRKSLEVGSLRRKNLTHRRLAKMPQPFFGESAAMKNMIPLLQLAADNESNVLLQGETGTGKGIFARWIHYQGSRSSSTFVEVNCSSLRGELLSNELFGHVRGAFTSAVETRQGLLDVADGGTLFLDEIADMDPGVQSQFLKVLEEKRYRRLGDIQERRSDFRLICATNRNLMEEASHGRFRKDLYFRINVLAIDVPPLRQRRGDLNGLTKYILDRMGASNVRLTESATELLLKYSWPGNIRELSNVLERGILLANRQATLSKEHLPGLANEQILSSAQQDVPQRNEVQDTLKRFEGDKKKAAEALGISRATLYRRLKGQRL